MALALWLKPLAAFQTRIKRWTVRWYADKGSKIIGVNNCSFNEAANWIEKLEHLSSVLFDGVFPKVIDRQ